MVGSRISFSTDSDSVDRIGDRIRDAEIHRREAGGIRIAEHRELERCRTAGKRQHPVSGGVPTKVDEDIDLVLHHHPCDLFIRKSHDRPPGIGQIFELFGGLVGAGHIGIARDVEMPPVVSAEEGFDKPGDRMSAEVRGDIADPDQPFRIQILRQNRVRRRLAAEAFPPAAMFVGDILRRIARRIIQGEQQIAVNGRGVPAQFDGLLEAVDRLIRPTRFEQIDAPVAPRIGIVRLRGHRLFVVKHGIVLAADGFQGDAQRVVPFRVIGFLLEQFL
jgi:hypothetical protein